LEITFQKKKKSQNITKGFFIFFQERILKMFLGENFSISKNNLICVETVMVLQYIGVRALYH